MLIMKTPCTLIDSNWINSNRLYIKRDDLFPFCFGGNKARKSVLFFQEIDKGNYDCVVTYGSSSSNHCRVIANECCRRGLQCYIISPEEASEPTFNQQMMTLFGAEISVVSVNEVHNTIEKKISDLKNAGKVPYFIAGGGHGNIGTEAYVQCYQEIKEQEQELGTYFKHIFFASGTGTTHAGLICGKLLAGDERSIVGISIARKNPRGRDVVINSVKSYIGDKANEEVIQDATIFIDDFTAGYGREDKRVINVIEDALKKYGIPLDKTYTGKAFMGMTEYIKREKIINESILFVHTGGTPLFFDGLIKHGEEI